MIDEGRGLNGLTWAGSRVPPGSGLHPRGTFLCRATVGTSLGSTNRLLFSCTAVHCRGYVTVLGSGGGLRLLRVRLCHHSLCVLYHCTLSEKKIRSFLEYRIIAARHESIEPKHSLTSIKTLAERFLLPSTANIDFSSSAEKKVASNKQQTVLIKMLVNNRKQSKLEPCSLQTGPCVRIPQAPLTSELTMLRRFDVLAIIQIRSSLNISSGIRIRSRKYWGSLDGCQRNIGREK
ncbi:unnamed protein product [Nezara viridula]|uniref:Uncharacterized protein n=1 Tax=Nezara viridula TaxID=85310 RepID=A0A9P0HU97_NEZVI|nr:unnamed protein product [Nezara viridula]